MNFFFLLSFYIIAIIIIISFLMVLSILRPMHFPVGLHLMGLHFMNFAYAYIMVCNIKLAEFTLILWVLSLFIFLPWTEDLAGQVCAPIEQPLESMWELIFWVFLSNLSPGLSPLANLSLSQNSMYSLMVWTTGSKPSRTMVFCRVFVTVNSVMSRISSSGKAWSTANGGNSFKFWLISTSWVIKS